MVIFGWGRQTIKQIGVVFKNLCSHCNNEDYWILTLRITWFTIFFIPILPYSIKYFLSCPICKYGLVLDQKQIDQIKPLAEINQLLIDGKITNEEYQVRLNQLSESSKPEIEVTQKLEPVEGLVTTKIEQIETLYCGKCGIKLNESSKFCSKCGTKI
ncbi:MAG: zinc-ribbon domain-containing protein [Bacteroidales bacterium]|nr:zinc-ribbon domain-containing protein [Bacteroidales bacterium]